MSDRSFRRRFPHLASLMPSPEDVAEHEQAILAAIRAECDRITVCPICGDEIDWRLRYCSGECAAEDEETDLSPVGYAGDRGIRPVAFDMPGFANALLSSIARGTK